MFEWSPKRRARPHRTHSVAVSCLLPSPTRAAGRLAAPMQSLWEALAPAARRPAKPSPPAIATAPIEAWTGPCDKPFYFAVGVDQQQTMQDVSNEIGECIEYIPALLKERDAGRIAHLGITETAPNDIEHVVLPKAIDSGLFDVVMVAFHVLHQNARDSVFPLTQAHGVATLLMFAVRLVFSQPDRLRATLAELVASGQLPAELAAEQEPLAFMTEREGLLGIVDAAYRYARHEAGVDVVLFGTGSIEHLATNIQSILADPLPDAALAQAREQFGHLVGVGLDAPNNSAKSAVSQ